MKKLNLVFTFVGLLFLAAPISAHAQGAKVEERKFADFLANISRDDLRALADTKDMEKGKRLATTISSSLTAKEVGKKVKIRIVLGDRRSENELSSTYISSKSGETIRVQSTLVGVSALVQVGPELKQKAKQFGTGKRMVVTGTLSYIILYPGYFNAKTNSFSDPQLNITIVADELER